MEVKKETVKLNDGGGLFDAEGLIDTLLIDCNDLPGALMQGRNVQFCSIIVQMVQKLSNLRKGVKADMDAMQAIIEEQKAQIEELRLAKGGKS